MKSRVILIFLFLMAYIPVAFGKGDCNPDSTKVFTSRGFAYTASAYKREGLVLKDGIYIISISSDNFRHTQKLIIG